MTPWPGNRPNHSPTVQYQYWIVGEWLGLFSLHWSYITQTQLQSVTLLLAHISLQLLECVSSRADEQTHKVGLRMVILGDEYLVLKLLSGRSVHWRGNSSTNYCRAQSFNCHRIFIITLWTLGRNYTIRIRRGPYIVLDLGTSEFSNNIDVLVVYRWPVLWVEVGGLLH